jgi:hypothetical protein
MFPKDAPYLKETIDTGAACVPHLQELVLGAQ